MNWLPFQHLHPTLASFFMKPSPLINTSSKSASPPSFTWETSPKYESTWLKNLLKSWCTSLSLPNSITATPFCMACPSLFFASSNQFKTLLPVLITLSRKYDHITPVLTQLHWLPVHFRIVLLVYKCLNGMCPIYLANLLHCKKSKRSLHSVSNERLLVPPSCLKSYGDRSFSVCAPHLWNSLPYKPRKSDCLFV